MLAKHSAGLDQSFAKIFELIIIVCLMIKVTVTVMHFFVRSVRAENSNITKITDQ